MPIDFEEERVVSRLAIQHGLSLEGVRTVLRALESGGGTMAQFSHPDFGGMSQWVPGMTMVGDMFNSGLKAKLDAICNELAAYLRNAPRKEPPSRPADVSYRSSFSGTASTWWPQDLGTPSSVGSQNNLRYAAFPQTRRLAIEDHGQLRIYDTGDHRISGVSQAQSGDQTLTFTSQAGLVRVSDLPLVSGG